MRRGPAAAERSSVAGRDDQTVPVTVLVHAKPHGSLPFTGSPVEQLTALGVVATVVGAAVVATVRRRSTSRAVDRPTRSQP